VSVVVVVVSPTTLPSLVCVVVVMVFFSLVPFWLSQPMVNTPNAEIRTNARKHFISIPFQESQRCPFASRKRSYRIIKKSEHSLFPCCQCPDHASAVFPYRTPRQSSMSAGFPHTPFSQPYSVRSHGECTP
jgi:hypothetical protein